MQLIPLASLQVDVENDRWHSGHKQNHCRVICDTDGELWPGEIRDQYC